MLPVGGEPGVVYLFDLSLLCQPLRNSHGILSVSLHPHRQSLCPSETQPCVKRTENPADGFLKKSQSLRNFPVVRANQSSEHITVPVQVLCQAMNDDIDPKF